MAEFKYDDAPTEGRFLILNDTEQEFPTACMKVVAAEEKMSYGGKPYPVLTLEDDDGDTYQVAAWKRDVLKCIQQFGTDPLKWEEVKISLAVGGRRYELVPAAMRVKEEVA